MLLHDNNLWAFVPICTCKSLLFYDRFMWFYFLFTVYCRQNKVILWQLRRIIWKQIVCIYMHTYIHTYIHTKLLLLPQELSYGILAVNWLSFYEIKTLIFLSFINKYAANPSYCFLQILFSPKYFVPLWLFIIWSLICNIAWLL